MSTSLSLFKLLKPSIDVVCRYLLAVHDPRTSTLRIVPTHKSPHILGRTVKKLKSLPTGTANSALAYREARTNLGEAFGTKKAKAAIRAEERNRVDVSAMQGVMSHVMEGIQKGAEGLLTIGVSRFVSPDPSPTINFPCRASQRSRR